MEDARSRVRGERESKGQRCVARAITSFLAAVGRFFSTLLPFVVVVLLSLVVSSSSTLDHRGEIASELGHGWSIQLLSYSNRRVESSSLRASLGTKRDRRYLKRLSLSLSRVSLLSPASNLYSIRF